MTAQDEEAAKIRPDIIKRTCGGWLAVSPRRARFRIGVTAATEDEAKENFRFAFGRWLELAEGTKNTEALDVPN
jgi:hypothetical protein